MSVRIVRIDGGLGNQTFQYIFARWLEETAGEPVILDDSYFFLTDDRVRLNKIEKPANNLTWSHNGYEIGYVFPGAPKLKLLSQCFDDDIWLRMVGKARESKYKNISVAQQLLENGMDDLTVIFESTPNNEDKGFTGMKFLSPTNFYNSCLAKMTGNVYYSGYWINPAWFNGYRDIMLENLTFRPFSGSRNLEYKSAVLDGYSVGVHIRRGDFVMLGWAIPESYFRDVFARLRLEVPNANYFIFSDQIDWCKENAANLGIPERNAVFVEGNFDYLNNYADAALMALCNTLVVGSSCFSYLASLLNRREGFTAINTRTPPAGDAGGVSVIQ